VSKQVAQRHPGPTVGARPLLPGRAHVGVATAPRYAFTVAFPHPRHDDHTLPRTQWPDREPVPGHVAGYSFEGEYVAQRDATAHAGRVHQAGYISQAVLDPGRCTFTDEVMTIAGSIETDDPEVASLEALHLARWALRTVYGREDYASAPYRPPTPLTGARIDVRPARRRAAHR
jgi:hypothetical protein